MNTLHRVLLAAALSTLACDVTFGIINGEKADERDLQFMASVQVEGKHKCGGLLISPRFVLTAAHCSGKKMSVVIGTHDIKKATQYPELYRYEVKHRHSHQSYKEPKHGYDLMILELSREVKLRGGQMIPKRGFSDVHANSRCRVAGWGETETHKNPVKDLMVTKVSFIDFATSKKSWGKVDKQLPPGVMCAGGSDESGVCTGDSGGPLVCDGAAVGIVSFNFDCNCRYPNVPNVYTNIATYRNWIAQVVGKGP